jgi:putative serine protease PepD
MRWWLPLVLVLLFVGRAHALGLPELAAQATPAVVLLTVSDSGGRKLATGTGFFVSADGRIVTNFHVIEGGASVSAKVPDGRELAILGVLAADPSLDIAILQAEGAPFAALTLGDSGKVRPGDEVVVIGSPLGLSATVTAGIVSAVRERGLAGEEHRRKKRLLDDDENDDDTQSWGIQISAAISHGSSGSPIMTSSGDVIAVAVGTRLDGQAVNFGVPIQFVKDLLRDVDPHAALKPLSVVANEERRKPGSHALLRNLGLSAGFFAGLFALYFVVSTLLGWRERRRERRLRAASRGR